MNEKKTEPFSNLVTEVVRKHFEAADAVRRGICLLNAGRYDEATLAFQHASQQGLKNHSLPTQLAGCLIGRRQPLEAAVEFKKSVDAESENVTARVRHALALWSADRREEAVQSLREGLRTNPECAEFHFQLGLLLAAMDRLDEAELRLTQTLSIHREHPDALVNLALCCSIRGARQESLKYLQRAQTQKPSDARIGCLLAQAALAVQQDGQTVRLQLALPPQDLLEDREGIPELSSVIESDPDFVDAFLAIPSDEVDVRVFSLLLRTLELALEHQPEHAELHFHCGRVLTRLGRLEDAIHANERAIAFNPKYTRALIELGKLYQKTDRNADAATRLEQAVAAGAEYADVFYMLGNLHQAQGRVLQARTAYRRALKINHGYEAAQKALDALPV